MMNDMNVTKGGFPTSYGYNMGGSGGDTGIILALLFSKLIGCGDSQFGGNDKDRLLIVEAINGKTEAIKDLSQMLHCSVQRVQETVCEVQAQAVALGVHIDCVKDEIKDVKLDLTKKDIKLDKIEEGICEVKLEVVKAFHEVALRDLQSLHAINAHTTAESEKTREEVRDVKCLMTTQEIQRLRDELAEANRCNNDNALVSRINKFNVNFGEQQSLNSVASKINGGNIA